MMLAYSSAVRIVQTIQVSEGVNVNKHVNSGEDYFPHMFQLVKTRDTNCRFTIREYTAQLWGIAQAISYILYVLTSNKCDWAYN